MCFRRQNSCLGIIVTECTRQRRILTTCARKAAELARVQHRHASTSCPPGFDSFVARKGLQQPCAAAARVVDRTTRGEKGTRCTARQDLRGDVAQHSRAHSADISRSDGGSDVVIPRSDVGGKRPQRVERSFMAPVQLVAHVLGYLVQRYMPGAFIHHLCNTISLFHFSVAVLS